MKKIKSIALLLNVVLFSTLFFYACKKKDNNSSFDSDTTINFTPAKTNNELALIRADKKNNVIRTLSDFDALVASKQSPLSKLPLEVIGDFRNHLTVRENVGIVGIKYASIYGLLSDDEFAEVMASFGLDVKDGFWGFSKNKDVINKMNPEATSVRDESLQSAFVEDYKGYECSSPHNCHVNDSYICLTGC